MNVQYVDYPATGVPYANPETPGQAIAIVRPMADAMIYETLVMSSKVDDNVGGLNVPLAHHLGIPLRLFGVASYPEPYHNPVTTMLGVVVDPADPLFGTYVPSRFTKIVIGSVVLIRKDEEGFDQHQAEALVAYCGSQLNPLYREISVMRAAGKDVRALIDQALEKMTPEAYKKFWEEYRDQQLEGCAFWAYEKCPVQLGKDYGTNSCGVCGGKEYEGGGALLQCSKCKKVRYCSKDCQTKDWKGHRITCKSA